MPVERWAIERKRDRAIGNYAIGHMKGIEIGPLCYPLLNKQDVPRLFYLDHATREDLILKYENNPAVEGNLIPQIDFVVKDGNITNVVSAQAPYDFVVASHIIEHVPDLITWLQQIESVLVEGGKLILIVPDKRFTFDIFRTLTRYGDVQAAYAEKRTRPDLWCLMDYLVNTVNASTWDLWEDYSIMSDLPRIYDNSAIQKIATVEYPTGEYVDTHCWVFTPWSFFDLMGEITRRHLLNFDCSYFMTTQDHDLEFYLHLTKTSKPSTDWAAIAERARNEALWPQKRDEGTTAIKKRVGLIPD